VVVSAQRIVLMGDPRAASEGTVLHEQLENRPLLRTSELLEVVPGLIVTQHTGDGGATEASRPGTEFRAQSNAWLRLA